MQHTPYTYLPLIQGVGRLRYMLLRSRCCF
nr:MAG TPA: hypothetical protein [Caudoviricetes sp.]